MLTVSENLIKILPCQARDLITLSQCAGTITVNDTLDLLAEHMGVGAEVAALTSKVTHGQGGGQSGMHDRQKICCFVLHGGMSKLGTNCVHYIPAICMSLLYVSEDAHSRCDVRHSVCMHPNRPWMVP